MNSNDQTIRRSRPSTAYNLVIASVVSVLVVVGTAVGVGSLPALGSTLNPGQGIWSEASAGKLPTDATIRIPGLTGTTRIGFEAEGVAHIDAADDADMFVAIGYVHARFRLFQMELERRQASGRLAEVVGSAALDSDKFERDLGLRRIAERNWKALSHQSESYRALTAYAKGVNAAITAMRSDGTLPMYYRLLGFEPEPWSPVDSLLVQMMMTQTLSYDVQPLTYTELAQAMGVATYLSWYQATPGNAQHPYDPGPYQKLPLQQLGVGDPAAPTPSPTTARGACTAHPREDTPGSETVTAAEVEAAKNLRERTAKLPTNAVHTFGNSNAWVVSGSRTASGKPILAADPHLTLSLPSPWFPMSATSPSYDMTGVSLPGMPVILLGKNAEISFGITNSQHGSTLYYVEQTDSDHPDQYCWKGSWQPMAKKTTTIAVKGQAPVSHTTKLTVHGPIISDGTTTAAVWWAGAQPSDELSAALKMVRAKNFHQFRAALAGWKTPALNFAFADAAGNIGIVNAGIAPQVAAGHPNLPMSGTGVSDVVGTIPYQAMPLTYNPSKGFAATSNQREVGTNYPYYFGWGNDFVDQGWRQTRLVQVLSQDSKVTVADTTTLQLDTTDPSAALLVPPIVSALGGVSMSAPERAAYRALKNWNFDLAPDSRAAVVWSKLRRAFEFAVLRPWWDSYHVPHGNRLIDIADDFGGYAAETSRGLVYTLAATDPNSWLFTSPQGPGKPAADLMVSAFRTAVAQVVKAHGADPARWKFKNRVLMGSLLPASTLDEGPFNVGSSSRSVNSILGVAPVRDGKPVPDVFSGGASWRFVIDWGTGEKISSLPGGLSENSTSPWYANGIQGWLDGKYQPVLDTEESYEATKGRVWTCIP